MLSLLLGIIVLTLVAVSVKGYAPWATFERHYTWGADEFVMLDTLRLREPLFNLVEVRPLVFAGFQVSERADGSYGIHLEVPGLCLRLGGVEGKLEVAPGTSPVGVTQVLSEHLPWSDGMPRVFRWAMCLSWGGA